MAKAVVKMRRFSGWSQMLGRQVAGLLLPGTCCLCRAEVADYRSSHVICDCCQQRLTKQRHCSRCSAVLAHDQVLPDGGCPWCHHLKLPFDAIFAVGNYEGSLRDALLQAKLRGGSAAAWDLGQLLAGRCDSLQDASPVAVPVPMYWTRRLRRGIHTAQLLAKSLASAGNWSCFPLVSCQRPLAKQSELPFSSRKANVRGAFAVRGTVPTDRPIVLVDDIMTTGATLTELGRVLRQAGAQQVYVAIVARSTPDYVNA
ncbi:phosphoribosyltransferase family protein [Bremerella sp. JC817]|uniref:ComF family protein n=1 Tax=Bremerella sp. JC817 TaxID=3231756 RepID=UPI003459FE15